MEAVFSTESRLGGQTVDRVAADFESFTETVKQSRTIIATIRDLEAIHDTKNSYDKANSRASRSASIQRLINLPVTESDASADSMVFTAS